MRTIKSYFLCAALCCAFALAGSRANAQESSKTLVMQYISHPPHRFSDDSISLAALSKHIDWQSLRQEPFPAKTSFTGVPVFLISADVKDFSLNHADTKENNRIIKAAFYLTDGRVYDGGLVELSSSRYSSKALSDSLVSIILSASADFTGHMFFARWSGQMDGIWTIKDGKVAPMDIYTGQD